MNRYKGKLDYTDGSNDYIEILSFIYRDQNSIAFEFKSSWSESGFWVFKGVANYLGQGIYVANSIIANLAVDPKIKDDESQIEFFLLGIDTETNELEVQGSVNYGSAVYPFYGLLDQLK